MPPSPAIATRQNDASNAPLARRRPWARCAWETLARMSAAAAVAALAWQGWADFQATPWRVRLTNISVHLAPGESRVLGRRELAAPAADAQHLRLDRDADGRWWLANVSDQRAVDIERDGNSSELRSLPLGGPQLLKVAGQAWTLTPDGRSLRLQAAGSDVQWRYDGTHLWRHEGTAAEIPQADCADARLAERLRGSWNRWAPQLLVLQRSLTWGGTAACGLQLPQPGLERGGLVVRRGAAGFWLQASAQAARQVCIAPASEEPCAVGAMLFERLEPLQGATTLTVGRTRLGLRLDTADAGTLHLLPLRRAGWLPADAEPPQGVGWQRAADDPWHWPWPVLPAALAWLALLAAGLAAAFGWRRHWARQQWPLANWALWSTAQWLAVAMFFRGAELGVGWSLALATVASASVVLMPLRTGWAWATHLLLALMFWGGLLLQWQLGVQAPDNGGWNYLRKTAAIGSAGLFSIQAFAWLLQVARSRGNAQRWPAVASFETALAVAGVAALVLLGMEVLYGGEEGVYGFQPVELAKLALVLLGANALALRLEWARPGGWRQWPRQWALWLRLVVPVLLFMALSVLALVWVHDYSPLLLMGTWLLGLVAAWAVARRSLPATGLVLVAMGTMLLGWWWLHGDGLAWMLVDGFYGERFAVWLDPLHHPHSGEQVLRALHLAAQGGSSGNSLAPAWRVPAVQDDMAPAFLLGRFGLLGAALLWAAQLAYIGCLVMLGWQALQAAAPGDYRRRWGLKLLFFAAWGAAALFCAHLALSWGTNTGALPVMGQPMPLISAGGSVIGLLLVPLHLLWTVQPALTEAGASAHTIGPGR